MLFVFQCPLRIIIFEGSQKVSKSLKQKDDEETLIATTDDSWHQSATKVAVTD